MGNLIFFYVRNWKKLLPTILVVLDYGTPSIEHQKDGSTAPVSYRLKMAEQMYPPADDTFVLMCGPPPMINFACQPNLDKLGFSSIYDLRIKVFLATAFNHYGVTILNFS